MNKLLLIDGNNFVHRAYHRFKKLHFSNKEGFPTTAIYGFKIMIEGILKDYNPEHICICFDSPEKTFRHNIYDKYKANRSKNPIIGYQYPFIQEWCNLIGIQKAIFPGYEGEDIIKTYITRFKEEFDEILVFSCDKDITQLIDKKVKMVDTQRNIVYGIKEVKDKFGVFPTRMVQYLALTGDTSDNIPGCVGIGKTGAVKIINEFGPLLFTIKKNFNRMKPKVAKRLLDSWDNILLSYKLAKIVNIDKINLQISNIERFKKSEDKLKEFYEKFNIRN